MPLSTTVNMLKDAQSAGIAVGAFNIENMEMAHAVISAAAEMNCPVILQTTSGSAKFAPMRVYTAMVTALAQDVRVPIALHMDHGNTDLVLQALEAGYTSVMYDGSKESFEENISRTKAIVEAATPRNIPVEAELGSVGGKEDDIEGEIIYTDPDMAVEFVAKTGVSSLAIAIGTAHGIYKDTPRLDIDRLKEIRKHVSVPLVLHGASGLSQEDLQNCIRAGICKINFATDLRVAYSDGVKEYFSKHPDAFDPRFYGKAGFDKVKAVAMDKMAIVVS